MLTTRPRGTSDILPGEVEVWHFLEQAARGISREYGYEEIRTPIFEHTELFERGVGEGTDIVEKEMYTFRDRGGRSITLRPEGTAPVVRAYLENGLFAGPQPVKLYYIGPMFRYDRPQAGRLRQFHQFGVEVFGSSDPALDVEVIAMAAEFYRRVGLGELELHINSVGCPDCRPVLRDRLREFFKSRLTDLCADCRERFDRNPLRILDCKEETCREVGRDAPSTLDSLCPACGEHFNRVRNLLEMLGIRGLVDERLVRGLDYYTRTAFEFMVPEIGAQSSVGGGGRYDGLVSACGGPSVPGIGFAVGLERVIIAIKNRGLSLPAATGLDVFLAIAGSGLEEEALRLLTSLRNAGLAADRDYLGRSLKAQMKYASKKRTRYTVILGESEMQRGLVVVRDMSSGKQEEVPLSGVVEYLKSVVTG